MAINLAQRELREKQSPKGNVLKGIAYGGKIKNLGIGSNYTEGIGINKTSAELVKEIEAKGGKKPTSLEMAMLGKGKKLSPNNKSIGIKPIKGNAGSTLSTTTGWMKKKKVS